jgi:Zn-dependent peptidase ImmA (M78 family)
MTNDGPSTLELNEIRNRAEKLLIERGMTSLPIDPLELAIKQGIHVNANSDTEEGVSGMLIRSKNTFGIMYATYLNNVGFERFSIAHELGHYFLPEHPFAIFAKSETHYSRAGFVSVDRYEREADTFAASLLMPEDLFRDSMSDFDLGLVGIESMASKCGTSLTATAIRYAELMDKPVGVIISTEGKIDWCCFSASFRKIYKERQPARGIHVPKGTATESIASDPEKVARAARLSRLRDIDDWSDAAGSVEMTEDAIGLGRYGKVLTVLSCPGGGERLVD